MGRSIPPLVFAVLALSAASREARGADAGMDAGIDASMDAAMTVTRGDGAQACPDATELRRIASGSHPPPAPTHVYRVSFEHAGGAIRAEIVDETTKRTRTLVDRGTRCAPLGEAVAVVLATMWSSERAEDAPDATPPPQEVQAPPVEPTREEIAPPAPPARPRFVGGAGGGIATGIVRTAAPAWMIDIALEQSFFAIALGALWIPRQTLDLPPGSVHVQLLAATLRGCAFLGLATRVGLCAHLFAGALGATGIGYDVGSHETRPWLAGGFDVFVGGALPIRPMRYRLSAGAVVPIHAETFSIAGVGAAYETPSIGGLVTLAIEIGTR